MLFTKQVDKVIITRPTVSKEDIGFLPGEVETGASGTQDYVIKKGPNKDKIAKELDNGNDRNSTSCIYEG